MTDLDHTQLLLAVLSVLVVTVVARVRRSPRRDDGGEK